MIRLFCGWDEREAAGLGVFVNSVVSRASEPVAIIPLHGPQGSGSNAFTYARFNVPELCEYKGWAIFADGSDMVCVEDIAKLWALRDPKYAVQVVKHDYKSNVKTKYIDTDMECPNVDYKRKNWSSLMLWNCEHEANRGERELSLASHKFSWLDNHEIGELPKEWNWLCDEYGPNEEAKILHWTHGIPGFAYYRHSIQAEVWHAEHKKSTRGFQTERYGDKMKYECNACRLCGNGLRTVLKLRSTPIANSFPPVANSGELYPLELRQCIDCDHVQIGHVIPDELLYGPMYAYRTPDAQREEMLTFAKELKKSYPDAERVLEIGANNGLFLEALNQAKFTAVYGVDPSSTDKRVIPRPFDKTIADMIGKVDMVIAKNVLAHVDDLHAMMETISYVLYPTGTLIFEVQYFQDLAKSGAFDMIYHEHKDYHQIKPLQKFLKRHGFGIVKVEHLEAHGGSIRVYADRSAGQEFDEAEIDWWDFKRKIEATVDDIRSQVEDCTQQVILYGAPAKACTLIHQCGIKNEIAYAVDTTPEKRNRFIAGTGIAIRGEDAITSSKMPKTLLLGAWNYEDAIRKKFTHHNQSFTYIVPFSPRQRQAA